MHLQEERRQEQQRRESKSGLGIEHTTDPLKNWDWGFQLDFNLLREKGVWIGKKIGDKVPGYRTFAGKLVAR